VEIIGRGGLKYPKRKLPNEIKVENEE